MSVRVKRAFFFFKDLKDFEWFILTGDVARASKLLTQGCSYGIGLKNGFEKFGNFPGKSKTSGFRPLLNPALNAMWRSSSNPAARRGIPAPAGAAAPDGGSFGGTVGRSLVCVNISNFSCCFRGCRRLAVRGPPLVRLVSSEPGSGP